MTQDHDPITGTMPPAPNREQVGSDDLFALRAEVARLREREKLCETMDKAEKLALIRSLQEIRDEVGLIGDGVSPRQIVEAVRNLKANA
jgi:hypothetical protein